MKKDNELPPGWDQERIRDVLDYYESQSDEDAALEHETLAARHGERRQSETVMGVPTDLVPAVRQLIAEYEQKKEAA